MSYGLVLEGGAMRGIYTAGVLDVLMEREIVVDGVIGVSAGALYGCSYVSGQIKRSIRYTFKYRSDRHFMGLYSLIRTGDIVGEEFCYHTIPEKLDPFDNEALKASDTKFYVTCTNVETGKAEYIYCTDLFEQIEYLRASASMPYVSKIVEIDGKKYLCIESYSNRLRKTIIYYEEYNTFAYKKTEEYIEEFYNDNGKLEYREYHRVPQTNSVIYYYDNNVNISETKTYSENGSIVDIQENN